MNSLIEFGGTVGCNTNNCSLCDTLAIGEKSFTGLYSGRFATAGIVVMMLVLQNSSV
jgi:hypothetical protein